MAYLLGYIFADGSLEDSPYIRGKYLRISSIDKLSIVSLKNILNSKHNIVETQVSSNRKPNYLLRIGSHKIFNDLGKHGLFPRKSLTIVFPKIPKKYLGDFIRGYFDGDGCVHLEKNKDGSIRRVRVIFTCGSFKFLEQLSKILTHQVLLTPRKVYKNTRSYQLRYSTHDSKKLFAFMYKDVNAIFMKRKFDKFVEYLELQPSRKIGKNIKDILRYHSGLVAKG